MTGRDGVLRVWSLLSAEFDPTLEETVGDLRAYAGKLSDRAVTVAALADERLLGAVSLYANDPFAGAYVAQLAVASPERGRGVAGVLLARAAAIAEGAGMDSICLEVREGNAAARRLYEGFGFEYTGGRGHYGLIMSRPLRGRAR